MPLLALGVRTKQVLTSYVVPPLRSGSSNKAGPNLLRSASAALREFKLRASLLLRKAKKERAKEVPFHALLLLFELPERSGGSSALLLTLKWFELNRLLLAQKLCLRKSKAMHLPPLLRRAKS
uniref:Uncharacterized protein n=1 Tax=Pseudopediastrum boryanum TaxID=55410 RepID=A0A2U8GJ41_PSEBY|nr:hypothetical protein [Pseudopediastrum boryanum]YP_009492118.1 hypothetical protein [Pseudopediastrum boryanum]AWI68652.1 hypothetical protein [Pseudopediastrum boryanum]AWI68653.1 hypothetical protein [Pseudopediastrum boryanum]